MEKTDKISNHYAQIEDIIEDIRLGKMVIIVDDEDRENEGDLMMAADKVKPEDSQLYVAVCTWINVSHFNPKQM